MWTRLSLLSWEALSCHLIKSTEIISLKIYMMLSVDTYPLTTKKQSTSQNKAKQSVSGLLLKQDLISVEKDISLTCYHMVALDLKLVFKVSTRT